MPERKVWTQEQDKILRLLREERGERKWANIARIMQTQFGVCGRTGKQCRQRYHNHLDSSIVNSQWTAEEEQILYQTHEQIGNKWSVISQKLPGRSDNCVKNHFYSKLRKAVRRLNKLITDYFSTQHKFIKESVLSKIVKTTESKFKNNSKIDEEIADFCNDIKNRLFRFQLRGEEDIEDIDFGKKLIVDIQNFDRDYKKGYKGVKYQFQYQYKSYLKPPTKAIKKNSSTQSCSSVQSDDSSSFLSSNSCFSSSDLSQFQNENEIIQNKSKKSFGSKSLGATSGRNSEEISKSQKRRQRLQIQDLYQKEQMENKHILKPHIFMMQHEDFIMQDSEVYDRKNNLREIDQQMIYDETPQIGSILAPREMQAPFYLFQKEQDNDEIEYKAQSDKMDIQ